MKLTEHKKERLCYILEELFNYLITILVSGVNGSYIAKITDYLGFSDSLTAILSAFVTLGYSAQILAGMFFRRGKVKKRLTMIFMINQLLFLMLYLVPFFEVPNGVRTALFVVLLLGGHLMLNIALAPRTNWFMSFVDNARRGTFTAKKEAVSLIVGFVFQLSMGAMIDAFEAQGNIRAAFVVCAIVILVLSVCHTLSLLFTQDVEVKGGNQSLKKELGAVIRDKKIRPILCLAALWAVAYNLSVPFYGSYTVKELDLSMSFLGGLSLVSAISRVLASVFLGRYADKHSFAKMLRLCYLLMAAAFLVATFAVPSNGRVMYSTYMILNAMAFGGINSATINLVFDYVKPENRTIALGARQAVYGVVGFLASTAVTPLLEAIQNAGNRFLGMEIYAQQMLSVLSLIATLLVALYVHKVVLKLRPEREEAV